jgi:pyridoxamine 5'-phosphate oxidase family protein
MFTAAEVEYLKTQRTGRLATVSPAQQPDVAPVGYLFDGETFTIRGIDLAKTLKYLNTKRGSERAAFVIDDYETADTSRPRGVKIHGRAEIVSDGDREAIRVTPSRKWSWGINAPMFQDGRRVIERPSQGGNEDGAASR